MAFTRSVWFAARRTSGAVSNGMAHRYLLWPLFGLSIAASLIRPAKWLTPLSALSALGRAGAAHNHKNNWNSTLDLWAHAHRQAPSSQSACGMFKQLEKAERHAEAFPFLMGLSPLPSALTAALTPVASLFQ